MDSIRSDTATPEIGPCRLIRELGAGGMGRVFLAELTEDRSYATAGTRVALKVLRPELLERSDTVRRFQREAAAGARVAHQTVVRTYEAGEVHVDDEPCHFLVLEYLEGQTLRDLMKSMGVLSEPLLRDLARQVAAGLDAIHEEGITHRDIKPENILLTPDHRVKLMDLGIAHLASENTRLTRDGGFVGTLTYAAPEQLSGGEPGATADLYSLGVVLYEAATGRQPFEAANTWAMLWKALDEVPARARASNPTLTSFFDHLIAQLLEKRAEDRFQSAHEVVTVLENGESSTWWLSAAQEDRVGDLRPPGFPRSTPAVPLVARETEITALWGALEQAVAGRGQVVWLEGASGVGKSRLVEEFIDRLESRHDDLYVLYGAYSRRTHLIGPGALDQALLDRFGKEALESRLAPYLPQMSEILPSLASHLRGSPLPAGTEPLTRTQRDRVFGDVAVGLSRRKPTVWIVEDVHHASPDSHGPIAFLAGQVTNHPILVIMTSVDDASSEAGSALTASVDPIVVSLECLSEEDVVDLLEAKLGRRSVANLLGSQLVSRTGGNPFFLTEAIKELESKGVLGRLSATSSATLADLDELRTPASVRELIDVRLGGLAPELRQVLDVAAVQEYELDPDLIACVLDVPRFRVLQTLTTLERERGLVKSAGRSFRFEQPQLHEVLYEAIPELLREEYHARSAECYRESRGLATDGTSIQGRDALVLASHSFLGNRVDEGSPLAIEALEHLSRNYRNESLVKLAAAFQQRLGSEHRALLCDILTMRADSLAFLARAEEASAAAREALEIAQLLEDPGRQARAGLRVGRSELRSGGFQEAQDTLSDALVLAREAGDRQSCLEILTDLGRIVGVMGRFDEARSHLLEQVALASQIGAARQECEGLALLTNLSLGLDRYDAAEDLAHRHLEVARREGFRESEATASFNLAQVFRWKGELAKATTRLSEQLRLSHEIGYAMGQALAHLGLLQCYFEVGRMDDAAEQYELGVDLCELSRLTPMIAFFELHQGDVLWANGDLAEAERLYRRALQALRSQGADQGIAHATFCLGRLLLEGDDQEQAKSLLSESNDLVKRLGLSVPGLLPAAYLSLTNDAPAPRLDDDFAAHASILAELSVLLFDESGDAEHLSRARSTLEVMSSGLSPGDLDQFWLEYPIARGLIRREGTHKLRHGADKGM